MGAAVAQAACTREPTVEVAGRARAERTSNILYMFVTLDVSKLSGWLNADARCREYRTGLGFRLGAGHAEEHTWNMARMVVTLEVSKLSGRLNAAAP